MKIDRSKRLTPLAVADGSWFNIKQDPKALELVEIDLERVRLTTLEETEGIPLDAQILNQVLWNWCWGDKTLMPEAWLKAMKEGTRIFFFGTSLYGRVGSGLSTFGTYVFGMYWLDWGDSGKVAMCSICLEERNNPRDCCLRGGSSCHNEHSAKKLSARLFP